MSFNAKFESTCAECNSRIHINDEVTFNSTNNIMHVQCPDDLDSGTNYGFCPDCFLSLPATKVCTNCQ